MILDRSLPQPTHEQSLRVLKILGAWMRAGQWYEVRRAGGHDHLVMVIYSDPDVGTGGYLPDPPTAYGVNHFDALCQATTAMQALLELSALATGEE